MIAPWFCPGNPDPISAHALGRRGPQRPGRSSYPGRVRPAHPPAGPAGQDPRQEGRQGVAVQASCPSPVARQYRVPSSGVAPGSYRSRQGLARSAEETVIRLRAHATNALHAARSLRALQSEHSTRSSDSTMERIACPALFALDRSRRARAPAAGGLEEAPPDRGPWRPGGNRAAHSSSARMWRGSPRRRSSRFSGGGCATAGSALAARARPRDPRACGGRTPPP